MSLAWAVAIAMMLGPPVVGAVAGWLLRRLRRGIGVAVGVGLALAPIALAPRLPAYSPYDVLCVGWLAAAGFAAARFARGPIPRGGIATALVTLSLGLGALEWWARSGVASALPKATTAPFLRWRFEPADRDFPCGALVPPESGVVQGFRRFLPGPIPPRVPGRRRILHIGDSMTEGMDVPAAETFAGLLNARRPSEEHLNLGVAGTGTDYHLLIARRWLPRLRPDEIVLHVFPGNDIDEMNRPYVCCGDGPLLHRDGDRITEACPQPAWRVSTSRLLRQGPSPFPLRVLATRSELAHLLVYHFERWLAIHVRGGIVESEDAPGDFCAALRAIGEEAARAGVPLTVAIMPNRIGWDGTVPQLMPDNRATYDRALACARSTGLRVIDAWPVFEAAWHRDPGAPIFQSDHFNSHFRALGHRMYADWLEASVWPAPGLTRPTETP